MVSFPDAAPYIVAAVIVAATVFYLTKQDDYTTKNSSCVKTGELPSRWRDRQQYEDPAPEVGVFQLIKVDRHPSGRVGGTSALTIGEPWTVLFEEPWVDKPEDPMLWTTMDFVLSRPDTVLYCIDFEEQVLIYLDLGLGGREKAYGEPFLDRGIRKHALEGAHVFVVSIDSAIEYARQGSEKFQSDMTKWKMTWVWNTGRCGSTLMHKMLSTQEQSLASLSEPYWFDQLAHAAHSPKPYPSDAMLVRLTHVCHVLEYGQIIKHAQLKIRPHEPTMFVMNPKGFGHRLIEYVVRAFPLNTTAEQLEGMGAPWQLRHLFMYRSCAKVVESFGSIFSKAGPPPGNGKGGPPPGKNKGGGGPPKPSFVAEAMKTAAAEGTLEQEPQKPLAAHLTRSWMDCVAHWMEVTGRSGKRASEALGAQERVELRRFDASMEETFVKGEDQLEEGAHLTLRMDEFVTKDLAQREQLVNEILLFVAQGEALGASMDMDAAMAAFESHSQKGSSMENSSAVTGAKFLDEVAVAEVEAFVDSLPSLAAVGGSNAVLTGSMGR